MFFSSAVPNFLLKTLGEPVLTGCTLCPGQITCFASTNDNRYELPTSLGGLERMQGNCCLSMYNKWWPWSKQVSGGDSHACTDRTPVGHQAQELWYLLFPMLGSEWQGRRWPLAERQFLGYGQTWCWTVGLKTPRPTCTGYRQLAGWVLTQKASLRWLRLECGKSSVREVYRMKKVGERNGNMEEDETSWDQR
jgi:hypothetical protein